MISRVTDGRVFSREDGTPLRPGWISVRMSPEEADQMLSEWATVTRDRDTRVRAAVAAAQQAPRSPAHRHRPVDE